MDMSSRAMLYFGVTVLVDYRYLGQQITREYLQVSDCCVCVCVCVFVCAGISTMSRIIGIGSS
jgi:hypothetical protein